MSTERKYGRRKPKRNLCLHLGNYLTGIVPEHPAAVDYLADLHGGWQMLGNDGHSDCVSVTWANTRRLITTVLGPRPYYPGMDQVIAFYKTQNPGFPGEDNGMDIQTALEYLVKKGGPDGVKAVAFAKVDHTNPDEVKAAIAIFGSVWVGVYVQQHNNNEFDLGMPWTWSLTDQVDGGHAIVFGGYGPAGPGGDEKFITWAQETSVTDNYWAHGVEECWVVIWPEHLGTKAFMEGMNTRELALDFRAITGQTLNVPTPPAPAPAPTPAPVPPPAPVPAPVETWLEILAAWLKKILRHL